MTWPNPISASSAGPRHRVASAIRTFAAGFLQTFADIPGFAIFTWWRARRDALRQLAQEQALRNLTALRDRKLALTVEAEILRLEIKEAKLMRKQTSTLERELQAVTIELLSIG